MERILKLKEEIHSSAMIEEEEINEEVEMAVIDQPLKSIMKYSRYFLTFDAEDHKNKLEDALRFIKGEINLLEDKMKIADVDMQKVY